MTHNHYFDTTNSLTINLTPSLLKPYPYLLPAHFHEKNHRTITPKSNVKAKPKHPASPPPPPPPKTPEWKTITTQKGDSLSPIFNRMQLNQTLLGKIIQKNPYAHDLKSIKPNEKIQFLFNKQKEVEKIIIPITITRQLAIIRQNGQFITKTIEIPTQIHLQRLNATIQTSLYKTVQRLHLNTQLIQQMEKIFSEEFDFSREIRSNDQFRYSTKLIIFKTSLSE